MRSQPQATTAAPASPEGDPSQAVWSTAFLFGLSMGTVAAGVAALLLMRARARRTRSTARRARSAATPDPWLEAGRRAPTPPESHPGAAP